MDAETFLGNLTHTLHPTWALAGVFPQRPSEYSSYIFPVLDKAARAAGLDPRWSGEGRELLYDVAWLPRNGGSYRLPQVVIEHENGTSERDFLIDQRKLLIAWAPLRVMIGYVAPGHEPEERLDTLRLTAEQGCWSYPDACADLALVGPFKMYTPRDYLVLHRPAGTREFTQLGKLHELHSLA